MKTGRVRRKATPPPEPQEESFTARPAPPQPSVSGVRARPAGTPDKKSSPPWILLLLAAVFVCVVIVIIVNILGGGADEWVEVTRANGTWTTSLTVFGPQVSVEERWESDCTNDRNATVRVGSCVLKEADTYQDTVIDDYEEYAYDIYHEETWDVTYQAQGTEFVATTLGGDDWWEENLHYTTVEELDRDSCEYTEYTLWVDDPQDASQEIEVYLSQCEVWDHVAVEERVYDQNPWCQCETTTLVQADLQSVQGAGLSVQWAEPVVPDGGRTEPSFQGQVTFLGDDYTYEVTTDDLEQYRDYLTSQYYLGLDGGKVVSVSKNPQR